MSAQTKTSPENGRGNQTAAGDISLAGGPQAFSQTGTASDLNNPPPERAAAADYPSAVDQKRALPVFTKGKKVTARAAVAALNEHFLNIAHAHTARGVVEGSAWAKDVKTIIGPHLWKQVRAIFDGWHTNDRLIEYLSAIHTRCFGNELGTVSNKMSSVVYQHGFLIGVSSKRKPRLKHNPG